MPRALKNSSAEGLGFLQEKEDRKTTTSFVVYNSQIEKLHKCDRSNSEVVREALAEKLEEIGDSSEA